MVPFGPQFIGRPDVLEQELGESNRDISNTLCPSISYLIFVTNAANAVRVKFLAECKKI